MFLLVHFDPIRSASKQQRSWGLRSATQDRTFNRRVERYWKGVCGLRHPRPSFFNAPHAGQEAHDHSKVMLFSGDRSHVPRERACWINRFIRPWTSARSGLSFSACSSA